MVSQSIIDIIIKAEDQVSQQAKKANDALSKFADTTKKANETASKSSDRYNKKLQETSQKLDKTISNVNRIGNEGSKSFRNLSKSQQDAVTKFNMLDKSTQTTLQAIREVGIESKGMFPDGDKALSSFSQLDNLTRSWSGSLDYAKTKMQLLGNDTTTLRGKIQTTGMAIQTYLGTKWDGIKNKVSSVAQSIKGKIGSAIDSVKAKFGGLTGGFNKLQTGSTNAGKGLGFLSGAASMAAGMIGFELFNSFVESGRAAINAQSQLGYFGKRLEKMDGQAHLSAEGFSKFKEDLAGLQKEFRKVDMTAVGATAEELAVKMQLPSDKLGDLTRMTAVMSSTFVKEGRTQEDAVLAVSDALDGQFQKLKEIGITKEDLVATGKWNGDLKDQKGLIDALNVSMENMGYAQTAKEITNLDDAFNVLSVSGGNLLAKIFIPLTPVIVGIVETLVNFADTVESAWNSLPDWGKLAIGFGVLAVALGLLVPALSAVEIATLPLIGTLYSLATAELAVSWPVLAIVAAVGLLVVAIFEVGKAFGWWADVGSMIDAISAGLKRLWSAFINNPGVQEAITAINDAISVLGGWIQQAGQAVLEFFGISTGGEFDIVRALIDGIGKAFQAVTMPIRMVIGVLQSLYNFALPIGQGIYNALKPIICVLLGCSPGIVPALQTVYEVFMTVWDAIVGYVSGVIGNVVSAIQPIIDILSQIANFYLSAFIYAWQTLLLVFTNVMSSINQVITIFSMFLSGQISLSTMLSMVWNTISVMFGNVLSIIIGRVRNFASVIVARAIAAGRGFVSGIINFVINLPNRVAVYLYNVVSSISSAGANWISTGISVASSMVNSVINNVSQLPGRVGQEFMNIGSRIVSAGSQLVEKAKNIGKNIVDGLLGAMGIHSPGIIQTKVIGEFEDTLSGVEDQVEPAGEIAKNFGETLVDQVGDLNITPDLGYVDLDNFKMPSMDVGVDAAAVDSTNNMVASSYDTLANMTGSSLQTMIDKDKNAYNLIRNNDATQLSAITTNLQNKMNTMSNKVKTSMDTMLNKNKTGLNNARNTTQTQLNNITHATVKANQKMIDSWNTMKTGIVNAASKIKSDSTSHFDKLESTIGNFYRKLQNPGGFGAGPNGRVSSVKRTGRANGFKRIAQVMKQYAMPQYLSLGEIQRNPFISTNNIGNYITPNKNNKYSLNDLIFSGNIRIPIGLEDPQNKGAGWTDGVSKHVAKIKDTSKNWSMKGPKILGKYATSIGFKVNDFMNGTPKIDYGTFRQMAEDVFGQTQYEFYYDDQHHGNWLNAFKAGSMNCYHGALALINFANACGLPGSLVHGHWNKTGHFWANIAGRKMDVTGWQNQRNWTPSQSHAGPAPKTSWNLEDLFYELKQELNSDEKVVVNNNGGELILSGEVTILHDFLNLPENISVDEIARLINDAPGNESWIKKLVKNTVFQKWDLKEKARIDSKTRRARGV